MAGFLAKIGLGFIVDMFRAFLGERSRDKGHQVSGEIAAEHGVVIAANERAKNAKEISDAVSVLTDDQLDDKLRGGGEDGGKPGS